MPLSVNNPILANEIADAQLLAHHRVFRLVGYQNEQLVIKLELTLHRLDKTQPNQHLGRKEALRTNVNLMHSVDPDAKVEVLSGAEVEAVREYVEFQRQIARELNNPLSVDLQDLATALGHGAK